jgi:hypothetical protein
MATFKACSFTTQCTAKRNIWRSQAEHNRSDGTMEAVLLGDVIKVAPPASQL